MAARWRRAQNRAPAAQPCGCRPGWAPPHPGPARVCGRRRRGGNGTHPRQPSQPATRPAGSATASR
eukprot:6813736-Alexandrium_andersonii.AAC.1